MKENRLKIRLNKSTKEVFEFLINPKNTPSWVEGFEAEETNEWPVRKGTIYRNKNKKSGKWSEYAMSQFEPYDRFEMTAKDGNYHVLYTFRPLEDNETELEYFERVGQGEIEKPFTQKDLGKLKSALNSFVK